MSLIRLIRRFVDRFGWFGFVRLAFYPVTTLVTTPFRLVQCLWSCRILFRGRWKDYSGFSPPMAMTSLFYWTQALNLYRFGRNGRSPYMGLGDFSLTKCFHLSRPSLYCFWKAGAVSLLLGMFMWLIAHFVWLDQVSVKVVLPVMFLTVCGTTFYASIFRQNYNVLGWMFFPVGIYGLLTQNWALAGGAWLMVSFGSSTVAFVAGILSVVQAAHLMSWGPIVSMVPAGLKLAAHLYPLFVRADGASIVSVMKVVGVTRRKVKYLRAKSKRPNIKQMYFFVLHAQFILMAYLLQGEIPVLLIAGGLIWLVNSWLVRFADVQSMWMLMLSLSAAWVIRSESPMLLLSYWLVSSPLPVMMGFPGRRSFLATFPRIAPFRITPLLHVMREFLSVVKPRERVLMAFPDPKGTYESLFDGYKRILEVPLYIASEKGFHFMPDWYGILETNYEGAPSFWGRDPLTALRNVEFWHADYLVVYTRRNEMLDAEWAEIGFQLVADFDWALWFNGIQQDWPLQADPVRWWLLKSPAVTAKSETC